jgi:hypothetical protein
MPLLAQKAITKIKTAVENTAAEGKTGGVAIIAIAAPICAVGVCHLCSAMKDNSLLLLLLLRKYHFQPPCHVFITDAAVSI